MTTLAPAAAHKRDQLIEHAGAADNIRDLFAAASTRLRAMVPFDAAVWLAFDPATNLPTAPTRAENLAHVCRGGGDCLRVWELEYLVDDVNHYRDLARAPTPAGGLRMATGGRPTKSPRYCEFIRPNGFDDELRATMRVDGSPWASIALYRESGRPPFDAEETELVASLSRPLAEAVREHARPAPESPGRAEPRGPGLMLFAPDGELISANDEALAWLDEVPPDAGTPDGFTDPLPMVVGGVLMRARAIADGRYLGVARARLRSGTSGRWLTCQASCLRDADGGIESIALVIEPAPGSDIAPIIVQAYGLSRREQEITGLIARGFGTADIADRLYVSPHTVRDHVKTIFEKVGVSSRGELVAKLFAEHYAPVHIGPGGYEMVTD